MISTLLVLFGGIILLSSDGSSKNREMIGVLLMVFGGFVQYL